MFVPRRFAIKGLRMIRYEYNNIVEEFKIDDVFQRKAEALVSAGQDEMAAQAADLLGVSRMSITRCYDEIEALGLQSC